MDSPRFIGTIIDAILSLPALGRVLLAPDGSHVAWTWYRKGPAADVYVAPTDGSAPPRRLTATANDTHVVSWAPDSASLVVAENQGGDERDQLFRLALDGTMAPLTEPSPPYFPHGGEIDASGCHLVFAANVDPETGATIEPSWVIRQDLASGERRALARPLKPNAYAPRLDRKGTRILYSRRDLDPAGTQVWMVGLDGSDDREILNFGAGVKTSASWFPDSRRLLVLAERPTHKRLGVYDTETECLVWLVDDPGRSIEGAYVPQGSDRIVAIEVREARSRSLLIDPVTGAAEKIEASDGTLLPLGPAADGAWIGRLYGARQPDTLVRLTVERGRARLAGDLADPWAGNALAAEDLATAEDVRWRSVDGLEIQGWLYRPKGKSRGLIVQVHGGPTAHSEAALSAFIQSCCAAGFSVLDPNYRGSTGFGVGFREAIRKTGWGGLEQEDIRTGIEAMIARGFAEPGRIGITGTSYGGYSSWHAITHWPVATVAAAAPICGMTDLVVDYETTRPDIRPYSEEMMGGSPATAAERYRERSPIHFVDRIRGRLLIVQGANDPNVTPENLHVVEEALMGAGIGYETLVFPDEGHGVRKPENLRILYARLIDFFATAFADTRR
ncbi:MAG TPA: prolyl oligopeptidase family serine peptidase [Stellaceae bacterium]